MSVIGEADRALLAELGLSKAESVAALLAVNVWRLIDFDGALWRTAGAGVWQRFETRIRATGNEPDTISWIFRLATKCHVSPQLIDKSLIAEARTMSHIENQEAVRCVRRQPGLVVSVVRAISDERRRAREERADGTTPKRRGRAADKKQDDDPFAVADDGGRAPKSLF